MDKALACSYDSRVGPFSFRRFVVSGDSMAPTYANGDKLLAVRGTKPRRRQIRVFEHPYRPNMWLVKRVESVRNDGAMWVTSDNADSTRADSREFGHLPSEGTYLAFGRIRGRKRHHRK